ncbi:NifB/NifX family molybdenum-iron cluster-binding protein [Gemmatimonadota bacterium]
MKICIPTVDDRGLEGLPSDHFGSAPFFTFVDMVTGEVDTQRNGGAHHVHGACRPLDFLGTQSVDAILCRGLGKRAYSRLQGGGISVYVTMEKDVGATVTAFRDGRLHELKSEDACHGHSQNDPRAGPPALYRQPLVCRSSSMVSPLRR